MAGLPARLELIDGHWQSLKDKPWDWNTVAELHRSVHGLVGSSGTLGLREVSVIARDLEDICNQWLGARNIIPGSEARARLQKGLSALVGAVAIAQEQPE